MKQILILALLSTSLAARSQTGTLHIYGPGGPSSPMQECARLYTQQTGLSVIVTAGPEKQWLPAAQHDADLIYGGAEYMLTQFGMDHPGFLLASSRTELGSRPAGILVRLGNPKGIHSMADLARPGVHLLDVNGAGQLGLWEDLAGRENLIPALASNIALSVPDSAEAIAAWNKRPDLDAWITYESWGLRLAGKATVVPLPRGEQLFRGTPIAIAAQSSQKPKAAAFLQFLHSPRAHDVLVKWGWQ